MQNDHENSRLNRAAGCLFAIVFSATVIAMVLSLIRAIWPR